MRIDHGFYAGVLVRASKLYGFLDLIQGKLVGDDIAYAAGLVLQHLNSRRVRVCVAEHAIYIQLGVNKAPISTGIASFVGRPTNTIRPPRSHNQSNPRWPRRCRRFNNKINAIAVRQFVQSARNGFAHRIDHAGGSHLQGQITPVFHDVAPYT